MPSLNRQGRSKQAREEDALSVKGYTGTLRANSHGTPCQAREDNAMRVDRYTDG
jgi:hypothetical protein